MPRRKVRVTHWLDRWIINPIIGSAVRTGLSPRAFALLETMGGKTGLGRVVPAGNGLFGAEFWIVAQDGYHCAHVLDLMANRFVRVKVPRQPWRSGRSSVVRDAEGEAQRREIEARSEICRLDGIIFRSVSTELVVLRIDLETATNDRQ
jgi:hypothetical protein